jgi:hypothetical protein
MWKGSSWGMGGVAPSAIAPSLPQLRHSRTILTCIYMRTSSRAFRPLTRRMLSVVARDGSCSPALSSNPKIIGAALAVWSVGCANIHSRVPKDTEASLNPPAGPPTGITASQHRWRTIARSPRYECAVRTPVACHWPAFYPFFCILHLWALSCLVRFGLLQAPVRILLAAVAIAASCSAATTSAGPALHMKSSAEAFWA